MVSGSQSFSKVIHQINYFLEKLPRWFFTFLLILCSITCSTNIQKMSIPLWQNISWFWTLSTSRNNPSLTLKVFPLNTNWLFNRPSCWEFPKAFPRVRYHGYLMEQCITKHYLKILKTVALKLTCFSPYMLHSSLSLMPFHRGSW